MKTLYGTISADGEVKQNSGEIDGAEHKGTGNYRVLIDPGFFDSTPVVVATVRTSDNDCGQDGTNRTISVTSASPRELCFGIRVSSAGDEDSDRPFNFIAVGE